MLVLYYPVSTYVFLPFLASELVMFLPCSTSFQPEFFLSCILSTLFAISQVFFFPLLLCDIFWVCHIFHLIFALTSSWGWTSSIHVYLTCQFVQTLIRLFLIYDYFLWSVINKLEAWSKLVLLQYLALPFMYINMEMPDSCRRGEQVRPADLFVCLFSTLCIYLWNSGNTSLTSKATHLSWQTSDPLNIRWIKGLTFVDRVTHDFSELRVKLYALLCS